ncbi:hypothetical protein GCM10009570_26660 [Dietzia natronolimnaea]|uniref:hypothetical protein n=1 Tax=Dietzia natronolimnaea TaxID=161920 RepID=UPI0015FBA068|nr:hypothetical protein [Dietzia natronolimnaea]MBB1039042.1 hypothetical protein [Dietzia natronolimnaea]
MATVKVEAVRRQPRAVAPTVKRARVMSMGTSPEVVSACREEFRVPLAGVTLCGAVYERFDPG